MFEEWELRCTWRRAHTVLWLLRSSLSFRAYERERERHETEWVLFYVHPLGAATPQHSVCMCCATRRTHRDAERVCVGELFTIPVRCDWNLLSVSLEYLIWNFPSVTEIFDLLRLALVNTRFSHWICMSASVSVSVLRDEAAGSGILMWLARMQDAGCRDAGSETAPGVPNYLLRGMFPTFTDTDELTESDRH